MQSPVSGKWVAVLGSKATLGYAPSYIKQLLRSFGHATDFELYRCDSVVTSEAELAQQHRYARIPSQRYMANAVVPLLERAVHSHGMGAAYAMHCVLAGMGAFAVLPRDIARLLARRLYAQRGARVWREADGAAWDRRHQQSHPEPVRGTKRARRETKKRLH